VLAAELGALSAPSVAANYTIVVEPRYGGDPVLFAILCALTASGIWVLYHVVRNVGRRDAMFAGVLGGLAVILLSWAAMLFFPKMVVLNVETGALEVVDNPYVGFLYMPIVLGLADVLLSAFGAMIRAARRVAELD